MNFWPTTSRKLFRMPFFMWTDEELAINAESYDEGIKNEIEYRKRLTLYEKDPHIHVPTNEERLALSLGGMGEEGCLNSKPFLGLPLPIWTMSELGNTSMKHNSGIMWEGDRRKENASALSVDDNYPLYTNDNYKKYKEAQRLRREKRALEQAAREEEKMAKEEEKTDSRKRKAEDELSKEEEPKCPKQEEEEEDKGAKEN